jgi:hypothetical protein
MQILKDESASSDDSSSSSDSDTDTEPARTNPSSNKKPVAKQDDSNDDEDTDDDDEVKERTPKIQYIKTKGEVTIDELPEETFEYFSLDDATAVNHIGIINSILNNLLVIKSDRDTKPLDEGITFVAKTSRITIVSPLFVRHDGIMRPLRTRSIHSIV